ncbi:MAG: hypothetical protein DME32_07450 [Verrucomicrobia bacterium]|nr:MAG: hypothetical protein DME32_07450 [Verrucomicrobiota bacterium]
MKTSLSILISIMPVMALADDPLPKRPDFNRYKAMLDRSPFAVATVAVPTATPDFAKDLYVANDARSDDGAFVTLASATDRNFKEYLTTKGPNEHGWGISDIQWSDQIGQTKVTITKDGKYATLTFNQVLLSQTSNQPQTNVQPPLFPPGMSMPAQPYQKPAPIPSLPPSYQQPIRPAPPQPGQVHQRGVIQRNPTPIPTPVMPVPNVPPPDDSDDE